MPRRALGWVVLFLVGSFACEVKETAGPGGNGNGNGNGNGGEGACNSADAGVPGNVQSAISDVCTYFVSCDVDRCDTCVSALEESYLGEEPLVQEQYAEALRCLERISCADLAANDLSFCTGVTCDQVYCGGDDTVCANQGCGTCGGDGYCHT